MYIHGIIARLQVYSEVSVSAVVKDTVVGVGGLGFDYRADQIGHRVANGSPPPQCFCVAQILVHGNEWIPLLIVVAHFA